MFCCCKDKKQDDKSTPVVSPGNINPAYMPDDTLNVRSFTPKVALDVSLPTKKLVYNPEDQKTPASPPPRNPALPPPGKPALPPPGKPALPPPRKLALPPPRKPTIPPPEPPTSRPYPGILNSLPKPTAVAHPSSPTEGTKSTKPEAVVDAADNQFAEIRQGIAIRDYEAIGLEELSFKKGDILEVVLIRNKDRWEGRIISSGAQGLVDAKHVSLKPSAKNNETKRDADEVDAKRTSTLSSNSTGTKRPWFKGTISKKQAEKLLDKSDKGTFLVREDESQLVFMLGIRGEGSSSDHYEIKKTPEGTFFIFPEQTFDTLDKLVKFYSDNKGGLVSELTKPCNVPDEVKNDLPNGTSEELEDNAKNENLYLTALGEQNSVPGDNPENTTDDASESESLYEAISNADTNPESEDIYEDATFGCSSACKTVEAIYDYEATGEDEKSMKEGDTLHVTSFEGKWWKAHTPETSEEGFIPQNHVAIPDNLNTYPWYFGEIDKINTETLLKQPGNRAGTFLVRQSATKKGQHTISVMDEDNDKQSVRHIRVCYDIKDNMYIYAGEIFQTLPDLIRHYRKTGSKLSLLHPYPKDVNVDNPTYSKG